MYQVGQSVIIRFNSVEEIMGTFLMERNDTIYTGGLFNEGDSGIVGKDKTRPATEEEILAEAEKHGWDFNIYGQLESPFDYFILLKLDKWQWQEHMSPNQENLKRYCEEGLTAHRFITALNQTK